MAEQKPVNPRFRAYGRARLEIARQAKSREEWNELWKPPQNAFPFTWGRHWKHCVEYRVEDYATEAGFFIDVLGFPVNAFDPQYAQFTGPDGEFFIAFMPASENNPATPPDALRLQFMVADLTGTTAELDRRGVVFDQQPRPLGPGSNLSVASFRTPHGIQVDLWGETRVSVSPVVQKPDVERTKTAGGLYAQKADDPLPGVVPEPTGRRARQHVPQPHKAVDAEKGTGATKTSPEIPNVDHFFPVHPPGRHKSTDKKLKIRLADRRPFIMRDSA